MAKKLNWWQKVKKNWDDTGKYVDAMSLAKKGDIVRSTLGGGVSHLVIIRKGKVIKRV